MMSGKDLLKSYVLSWRWKVYIQARKILHRCRPRAKSRPYSLSTQNNVSSVSTDTHHWTTAIIIIIIISSSSIAAVWTDRQRLLSICEAHLYHHQHHLVPLNRPRDPAAIAVPACSARPRDVMSASFRSVGHVLSYHVRHAHHSSPACWLRWTDSNNLPAAVILQSIEQRVGHIGYLHWTMCLRYLPTRIITCYTKHTKNIIKNDI